MAAHEQQQHPRAVVADVGGEPQLGAGRAARAPAGRARARLTRRRLSWRFFGQGSGNRMKPGRAWRRAAAAAARARRRVQTRTLASPRSSIARQRLGDAVDERLAADQADLGIGRACAAEMLAAAEADLEPDRDAGAGEQRARVDCGALMPGRARRRGSSSSSSAAGAAAARPRRRP